MTPGVGLPPCRGCRHVIPGRSLSERTRNPDVVVHGIRHAPRCVILCNNFEIPGLRAVARIPE
jgi:hypothetical protein